MSIRLLHDPDPTTCAARPAFEAVLAQIASARSSIEIHMYVWRSDEIGTRVGAALHEVIPLRIAAATKITAATELNQYKPLLASLQQLHQKWNPS